MKIMKSDLLCSRTTSRWERLWFYIRRKEVGDLFYLGKARQIITKENDDMYSASFWTLPGTEYIRLKIRKPKQ